MKELGLKIAEAADPIQNARTELSDFSHELDTNLQDIREQQNTLGRFIDRLNDFERPIEEMRISLGCSDGSRGKTESKFIIDFVQRFGGSIMNPPFSLNFGVPPEKPSFFRMERDTTRRYNLPTV